MVYFKSMVVNILNRFCQGRSFTLVDTYGESGARKQVVTIAPIAVATKYFDWIAQQRSWNVLLFDNYCPLLPKAVSRRLALIRSNGDGWAMVFISRPPLLYRCSQQ